MNTNVDKHWLISWEPSRQQGDRMERFKDRRVPIRRRSGPVRRKSKDGLSILGTGAVSEFKKITFADRLFVALNAYFRPTAPFRDG